jgi:hypothetical protein
MKKTPDLNYRRLSTADLDHSRLHRRKVQIETDLIFGEGG